MAVCQVYLYEEQKQFLLKYIHERRFSVIMNLWCTGVLFFVMFLLMKMNVMTYGRFVFDEMTAYSIIIMAGSGAGFVTTFIRNFGKTFGYGCDKKCIENGWYTITSGKFVYRDKNPHNRHPYYLSDRSYNKYICPRFLDWRNADENTMLLYIKLENGRGYAIVDN